MPFSSNAMNRSNIAGATGGFTNVGFGGTPNFNMYNNRQIKFVRGGGGQKPAERAADGLNFSDNKATKLNSNRPVSGMGEPNVKDNRFRSEHRGLVNKKDIKKQNIM